MSAHGKKEKLMEKENTIFPINHIFKETLKITLSKVRED